MSTDTVLLILTSTDLLFMKKEILYLSIAKILEKRIRSEIWKIGHKLPSLRSL